MEVARTFDAITFSRPALLTIGTFDGVHRGHRYLLEQAHQRAAEQQYGLVIVTFDPCPAVVLRPSLGRYQLTSATQKLRLLGAVEPAAIAILHFTPELSLLTAGEFMDALEVRLDLRELWFGEDFRFGRDRGGDLQMLVERGRESSFSLHVVSRRMEEKKSISSSRIRLALASGDVDGAIPLLGYPFTRACTTTPAATRDGVNAALGYDIDPHLALPADSVYAALASVGGIAAPSVVEVRAGDMESQLRVRVLANRDATVTNVEFIKRLCSRAEYQAQPQRWEELAVELLRDWRQPEFAPSGQY